MKCEESLRLAFGPGWRTAHASSIDVKGRIVYPYATSAPPRAGTTGIVIYGGSKLLCVDIYSREKHRNALILVPQIGGLS